MAPAAARLGPDYLKDDFGEGLFGLISSGSEGNPVSHFYENPYIFHGYEDMGELVPDVTFIKGVGLYVFYALFDAPVTVPLSREDWTHFIGFCDRLPEEAPAYIAEHDLMTHDFCDMYVYRGSVSARYSLDIMQLEHYRHPHDFVRDDVICAL